MKTKNLVAVAVVGLSGFILMNLASADDACTTDKKPEAVAEPSGKTAAPAGGEAVAEVKPSPGISGTKWKLTGWSEKDIDPAKFRITAEFKDKGISGRAAVNRYFGECKAAEDGSFSAGGIGLTRMAGPKDAMRAEQLYLDLLQKVRKYAVEGEKLRLCDEEGKEIMVFEKN